MREGSGERMMNFLVLLALFPETTMLFECICVCM